LVRHRLADADAQRERLAILARGLRAVEHALALVLERFRDLGVHQEERGARREIDAPANDFAAFFLDGLGIGIAGREAETVQRGAHRGLDREREPRARRRKPMLCEIDAALFGAREQNEPTRRAAEEARASQARDAPALPSAFSSLHSVSSRPTRSRTLASARARWANSSISSVSPRRAPARRAAVSTREASARSPS